MPRVKLFKEEEVLEKAVELFWKKGYGDTSMQDLVDYLGINRASLYDTFGGKQALFKKALTQYRLVNNKMISAFLSNQTSVKEGLLKLFELPINASFNKGEVRGCFIVNTITELITKDEEIQTILVESKNDFEDLFYEFLKKGLENGEIAEDKDLKYLSSFLYTLLNGVLVIAKVNPDKKYLLSIVETGLAALD